MEYKSAKYMIIGGHLTPAIAVLEELKQRKIENIVWVGTKYTTIEKTVTSAEYRTVIDKKVKFINLVSGKIYRKWNKYTFKSAVINLAYIPFGVIMSFYIIAKNKPDVIISFGGYLAVPITFWGYIFRKRVYTHEQTVITGLANKIVARFARKVFISWEQSYDLFPRNKTILTGNPMPKFYIQVKEEKARRLFDNDLKTIFVTGGNQGSHKINENLAPILDKLLMKYNVIHQTGNTQPFNDYDRFSKKNYINLTGRYLCYDYMLGSEHARHYRYSDLVISRSGANTMSNLMLYKRYAILIPIPWASQNEQYKNAKILEAYNLATIIQQESLTPEVLQTHIENYFTRGYKTKPKEYKLITDAEYRIVNYISKDMGR